MDKDYMCELDSASIAKAKKELNENPEDRLAAVQALRDWIKAQPHLKCPETDTLFLLRLLRWAKFSQIRAREKLENYLNLRNVIPSVYANMDMQETVSNELLTLGYAIMLPDLPDGSSFMMVKVDCLGKTKYKYFAYLKIITAIMEYWSKQDMHQVNGTKILFDFTGTSSAHIVKFANKDNAIIVKEWSKSTPARFKGFYYYNPGLLAEIIMVFLKPIMAKKLMERMSVHDTMESIYPHIPKKCLPMEYLPDDYVGPNAGSLEYCIRQTKSRLQEQKFREHLLYKSGNAFGVDMERKPLEKVAGYFRKLNVD